MSAILFKNASFSYERNRPVLSIREFAVEAGERVFLHGPSGSGKTTLLGLVTGVLVASDGTVSVLNEDLKKLSTRKRDRFRSRRMGYIFQQFNLIPYLNVVENILLPVWMNNDRKKRIESSSAESEAIHLAERLGLADFIGRKVLELSVGQQQRVAVARALIGHPDLIVADEPTSALDEDRQQEFVDLLLERSKESRATVLFVSHNKRLAEHFDRSVSLKEINTMSKDSGL